MGRAVNVVDSAGWIEYLRDGTHAGAFARAIEDVGALLDLDGGGWLRAAELGVAHRLGLADSVVLAVARGQGATLWTGNATLAALDDVERRAASGLGGPPLPTS
jgi:predicted nucleic acid-binding protein